MFFRSYPNNTHFYSPKSGREYLEGEEAAHHDCGVLLHQWLAMLSGEDVCTAYEKLSGVAISHLDQATLSLRTDVILVRVQRVVDQHLQLTHLQFNYYIDPIPLKIVILEQRLRLIFIKKERREGRGYYEEDKAQSILIFILDQLP